MKDTNSTDEIWLPVVGFETMLEISNMGRLRTIERVIQTRRGPRRLQSRIRKTYPDPYDQVVINVSGRARTLRIHVAVATAFIGPKPEGMEVCHNNGDARDNRAENLRWDTHRNNTLDMNKHGTRWQLSRTHCPKGHEYTSENTYILTGGRRQCKTCTRQYSAKRRAVNQRSAHPN